MLKYLSCAQEERKAWAGQKEYGRYKKDSVELLKMKYIFKNENYFGWINCSWDIAQEKISKSEATAIEIIQNVKFPQEFTILILMLRILSN